MATDTHAAAEHAAEVASAPGMPQLDFSNWANQIFWLLITLAVIYLVLTRIAIPRIAAVLSERQGTITNDLAAAEDLKARAVEAEEAYNQALADSRAEAHRIVAEAKAEIQAELDAATDKADAEIAAKAAESEAAIAKIRAGALESVRAVALDTAGEVVSAMGGTEDEAAVSAAVETRMKG